MSDLEHLCARTWRYALALTRDRSAADDLCQEAWAATLAAGRSPEPGYLLRAVRSRWIDAWRRQRDHLSVVPDAEERDPSAAFEARSELAEGWATLSDDEREALYLHVVEGFTAAEISELVGSPRNTVLSWLHRGRAHLRGVIEERNRRTR
jgi:RNA polymerase sigma-70 factor (ECF subfamily)